jgi:hypothetical protein
MIDGHAHLDQIYSEKNTNLLEILGDYEKQLEDAGFQKGIVIVKPRQLGLYSDNAIQELSKWGGPTPNFYLPSNKFNQHNYEIFLNEQSLADKENEIIYGQFINNPKFVKLLRVEELQKLMENGMESECEDVLKKAKDADFAGIKLYPIDGLHAHDDQIIRMALELGLKKIQFHTSNSYDVAKFLNGGFGVSLGDITEQILQGGGKLYLVHGAYLPLRMNNTERNGVGSQLERLLELSKEGVWLGLSSPNGVSSTSDLTGNSRGAILKLVDSYPHLENRISFETDYPFQGEVYEIHRTHEAREQTRRENYSSNAYKAQKTITNSVIIKEIVDALKDELNGLDTLQNRLFNNAQSFVD